MKFDFSVDELVVVASALRYEYRRNCECANIERRNQLTASTAEDARTFLDMENFYDERCAKCEDLYEKIIGRNIFEDM